LRTFVCFGLFLAKEGDYNELVGILRKVFPNLTTWILRNLAITIETRSTSRVGGANNSGRSED